MSDNFFEIEIETSIEPQDNVGITYDGGKTWQTRHVDRPLFKISYADNRYQNKTIESLFLKIKDLLQKGRFAQLAGKTEGDLIEVKHKLYAVDYHLIELIKEVTSVVEIIKNEKKVPDGAYTESLNSKLIYELEALLFQVKACLDRIARVLRPVMGFKSLNGFNGKGKWPDREVGIVVINALRTSTPKTCKDISADLIVLLEKNIREWIKEDNVKYFSHN